MIEASKIAIRKQVEFNKGDTRKFNGKMSLCFFYHCPLFISYLMDDLDLDSMKAQFLVDTMKYQSCRDAKEFILNSNFKIFKEKEWKTIHIGGIAKEPQNPEITPY